MYLQISKIFSILVLLFNLALAQTSAPTVLPAEPDSIHVYESNLSYKKNNFGGLLITKRIEDNLRITLTSKFGLKIFDYLLSKDSIETIYSVDALNKKIIKKILYKDFRIVYPFLFDAKKIHKKGEKIIIKKKMRKYKYLYEDDVLTQIRKGAGLNKVNIEKNLDKIDHLEIIHTVIGLKIKIKPLILSND